MTYSNQIHMFMGIARAFARVCMPLAPVSVGLCTRVCIYACVRLKKGNLSIASKNAVSYIRLFFSTDLQELQDLRRSYKSLIRDMKRTHC